MTTTSIGGDVVLSARGVVKDYGATRALRGVDFDVRRGRVTTLFGENGAGKSTLMKILAGVESPTSGEVLLDGRPVAFSSAGEARESGISIIHQELSLAPNLSVRDNVFLGRELRTTTGVDYAEEERRTAVLLRELEEDLDPLTPVSELRLGQQQIVEIARALSADSRILIMDEPTSALSASEVAVLFRLIGELRARGVGIVYISHHLEEALQVTDHAVVLRDGSVTAAADAADIDLPWVVRQMVGENFDLGEPPTGRLGDVALSVRGLSVADPANPARLLVDGLSLDVRRGEVVCLYGLMGAGRTELLEAVAGRVPTAAGQVLLAGEDVTGLGVRQRIERGLGLVPEDRQRDGLVATMTVERNLTLARISRLVRGAVLVRSRERALAEEMIAAVGVKTAGPEAPIGSLSGGNQQKVVIGKIMSTRPAVILLDEPTRGIDVGAKAEVLRLLIERAAAGLAVVYSTSELAECFSIAHRIVVLRRGRTVAEFGPDATKEDVMAASGEAVDR